MKKEGEETLDELDRRNYTILAYSASCNFHCVPLIKDDLVKNVVGNSLFQDLCQLELRPATSLIYLLVLIVYEASTVCHVF